MKVTREIIQPFPNNGPKKAGGRKKGRYWILIDTPEKSETVNQSVKNGRRKYSGKAITKKMVKKSFIIVDCSEEIPHADCVTMIM
jgi:NDP-sugar pyrophosphorylase family protein